MRPTQPSTQPQAGASNNQEAEPRRLRMLSAVADASVDIRKACNGIKRMSSLGAASMVTGMDPKKTVAAAEAMAFDVLESIGFDVKDASRLASVMPMMLEATSLVIADAAYHAEEQSLGEDALLKAAKFGVGVLSEIAKSRAVAKMVEPSYPSDMDSIVALRISAASAMAQVAVEIAEFDFMHTSAECVREAGKLVVKAATQGATKLAPSQASTASRLMLTQSLVHSAAKVYAAAWRAVARDEAARLDALSSESLDAALAEMEAQSLASLIEPVNKRFLMAFSAVTETAAEVFAQPAATTDMPRRPTQARPK